LAHARAPSRSCISCKGRQRFLRRELEPGSRAIRWKVRPATAKRQSHEEPNSAQGKKSSTRVSSWKETSPASGGTRCLTRNSGQPSLPRRWVREVADGPLRVVHARLAPTKRLKDNGYRGSATSASASRRPGAALSLLIAAKGSHAAYGAFAPSSVPDGRSTSFRPPRGITAGARKIAMNYHSPAIRTRGRARGSFDAKPARCIAAEPGYPLLRQSTSCRRRVRQAG